MISAKRNVPGRLALLALVILSGGWYGCGSKQSGPDRFSLSGSARFDGKPIPFGSIVMEPDSKKGNGGPAGVADIRQGKYQIRNGFGHVGGPHVLTIRGTDGTHPTSDDVDNSLFSPYVMHMDLPEESSTIDINVPQTAASQSAR